MKTHSPNTVSASPGGSLVPGGNNAGFFAPQEKALWGLPVTKNGVSQANFPLNCRCRGWSPACRAHLLAGARRCLRLAGTPYAGAPGVPAPRRQVLAGASRGCAVNGRARGVGVQVGGNIGRGGACGAQGVCVLYATMHHRASLIRNYTQNEQVRSNLTAVKGQSECTCAQVLAGGVQLPFSNRQLCFSNRHPVGN